MAHKTMVKKTMNNKIKSNAPTLKFGKDLFVSLPSVKRRKK